MATPNLRFPALASLLVAMAAAAPIQAQSAQALLAQFRGEVTVHPADSADAVPARVGLRLERGDSVHVPRGGRAVLLFNNGRLVTATSPVTVGPPGRPGASTIYARAAQAAEAARGQSAPEPVLGAGRPSPAGTHALAPIRGSVVPDGRPTFRWRSEEPAEEYVLQIRPEGGGAPQRFTVRGGGPFTLPDSVSELTPGATYAWLVVGMPGGRPPGEERFVVLDEAGRETIAAFRASLSEAGVDPDTDGLFLMASLYEDLGLLHEAEAALDALDRLVPAEDQDPVVDLMRTRILEQLGRIDEAVEAYRRATERR